MSFSLTFLTQGIANDFSYEEHSEQLGNGVADYDAEDVLLDEEQAYEPRSSRSQNWLSDAEQQGNSTYSQSSSNQSQDCLSPYHRMHVSARHNESKGIGYHDGYTTLEAFGIYDGWSSHFMPFLDLRGHVFNNGKLAGNVGIGERTLMSSINHTFGSYLYYDVRRVGHGLTVNQLSPGLELVGRRMEYRINGYFPLGKDKTHKYNYKFDEFEGHNIILKSKQQRALRGGDAEVGVHVTQSTKYDLYAAAGPYYLHAPHAHSWGGRTRLVGRYKEYVSLEVAYSYDNLFRSIVQGSVAVTLPFGKKLKRTGQGCPQGNDLLLSRASFAPSRFEIPVVKRVKRTEKAINPATGKPWTVWFVDNTSHSAGTYGSPFPTLLQAQNASSPNDMIYVFPGDGTTTGMDAGITLQDGQSFFGSGIKQHIRTTKGKMTIPTFSQGMPMMAGGVTTGNSNVISGFNVTTGIVGNSVATNLNNLTVINNQIAGVIQFQGTGEVNICNNAVSDVLSSSGIILLAAPSGLITGKISNNFLKNTQFGTLAGIDIDNLDEHNPGRFDLTIENNMIEGFALGIVASVLGTNSMVAVNGNIVDTTATTSNSGILFYNATAGRIGQQGHMIATNNTVTMGKTITGIAGISAVDQSATSATPFQDTITFQNNIVNSTGNISPSGGFQLLGFNKFCVTVDNNTVTGSVSSNNPSYAFAAAPNGTINIDSFENNVGAFVEILGNVNFVAEGTCGE